MTALTEADVRRLVREEVLAAEMRHRRQVPRGEGLFHATFNNPPRQHDHV